MHFSQYYLACLSHASYLVGDTSTGRAVVVDPQRDVTAYLADAARAGLHVTHVIETHFHADFLSGHLELAARTGAEICFGDAAEAAFPFRPLADGERLVLGDVVLEVLATPGHTPESISVVVYEHADDAEPYGVLTGDTLFIGDVGRPDLLAGAGIAPEAMARQLHRSLRTRLLALPDSTRVFPAHGAGSACGRSLSTETSSTIGTQRATNYALAPMAEDDFVRLVTEGERATPLYFSFDARRNREAHALLAEDEPPRALSLDEAVALQAAGAVVLDTREPADFAAGHLAGAVNVGLAGRFAEYAGDVLRPDEPIVLAGSPETALEAKVRLGRIGFDAVVGHLADPVGAFVARPDLVRRSSRLTAAALHERAGDVAGLVLVDVRNPAETSAGHLPGATLVPLSGLLEGLGGLDPSRPTVVYCAGGYRSAIAASVLARAGFVDVSDLLGGYDAWRAYAGSASTTVATPMPPPAHRLATP